MKMEVIPLQIEENMQKFPKGKSLKGLIGSTTCEEERERKVKLCISSKVDTMDLVVGQSERTSISKIVDVMYFTFDGSEESTFVKKKGCPKFIFPSLLYQMASSMIAPTSNFMS